MFTLLIKYRMSGRECLSQAASVEYISPNGPCGTEDPAPGLLITLPDDNPDRVSQRHLPMTSEGDNDLRDVYIMNEQGQTVGHYVL